MAMYECVNKCARRCCILFHLFCVELRVLFALYVSVILLVKSAYDAVFLALRSSDVEEWCQVKACSKSLYTISSCVDKGLWQALLSLDRSYENAGTCVKFHGDNFMGWINYTFLVLMALFLAYTLWLLKSKEVHSFRNGKYMTFTTFFLREQRLVWWVVNYGFLFLGFLVVMGPLTIIFAIPQKLLDEVGATQFSLIKLLALKSLPAYATAFLVAWHLRDPPPHPISFTIFEKEDIEFKRSCWQLLTQTNREFMAEVASAVVRAKYGKSEELEKLLVNPEHAERVIKKCDPQKTNNLAEMRARLLA